MSPPPFVPSTERLAALVESSDDAIIGKDTDGTIHSWNRAAERLLHYTAEEAIGQPIHLIIPATLYAQEDEALRRVLAGERVSRYDTQRVRKDGAIVHVSVTVSPIGTRAGQVVGTSEIARDVGDRRRIEGEARRLVAIVESSDDAIIGKDLNGIVTSWNDAAERLFGYAPHEMIGRSIRAIIPGDRLGEEDDVLNRMRHGKRVDRYDTFRQRKDRSIVPVSLTVSPILDAHAVVIGASTIARDITEQREAEADRVRLLTLLQESSRLKDEFLATLSHELRTPLNAIVGYTRMIRSGLLTGDQQARGMSTIERNSETLTRLVQEILEISRVISGRIRLNVEPIALQEIIGDTIEGLRTAANAKGVQVHAIMDASVGPVSGDHERLQQVVWNVVSNAVKFTDRGGRVQIRLQRVSTDAELSVADTGVGISHAFLPHVFERFRQEDAGPTRERGGLGIGLAIARHLVELHGGTIQAASAGEHQGATFVIRLPLIRDYRQQAADAPNREPDRRREEWRLHHHSA